MWAGALTCRSRPSGSPLWCLHKSRKTVTIRFLMGQLDFLVVCYTDDSLCPELAQNRVRTGPDSVQNRSRAGPELVQPSFVDRSSEKKTQTDQVE